MQNVSSSKTGNGQYIVRANGAKVGTVTLKGIGSWEAAFCGRKRIFPQRAAATAWLVAGAK
ncbi:hypothetical protein SEA_OTTAWA_78 [Arthrobacter phage Ottawa]|nr:hypothetical protein SEA_KHARCHO_78 [Arthrobacter phage Kharcho]WIC89310.1 hypothetical protein SEA_OTTAWA_78 [Arthrobacter phage Ottawa]